MIGGLRNSLVLVVLWQDPLRPSAAKPILALDAPLTYRCNGHCVSSLGIVGIEDYNGYSHFQTLTNQFK